MLIKSKISKTNKNFIYTVLITLFCLIFLLATALSGLKYSFGYGFWNAHGHDAIWHLAVSNQTLKSFPPLNPVYSGYKLVGYHWGYDLLLQLVHIITKIPSINLYFQIFPIFITTLIALFSFKLKKTKLSGLLFVFLNFFAGSFGYIVTLIKDGKIGGESIFWSMQSISTLINPPYALSLVILLSALYYWQKNQSNLSTLKAIFLGIFLGLTTIIKIYAAVIVGLAFSLLFIYQTIRHLKQAGSTFWICFSMTTTSVLLLYLIGLGNTSLIFKPFWFINSLVDSYDKLYLPKISAFRFNISQTSLNIKWIVLLLIQLLFFIVFLLGNLGARIYALLSVTKKVKSKKTTHLDSLFLFASIIAILIPTLFIQSGTAWNSIQFFYYFLIIANFYFADYLEILLINKRYLLFAVIIIFTLPTTISTIRSFIGFPPPSALPNSEIKALQFLQDQPSGMVLTYPYDAHQTKPDTPIPLSVYQTTAYVSAFSQKISFLEDYVNLSITGFDWQQRLAQVNQFFKDDNQYQQVGFLLNNNIDYIYLNQADQTINPKISHQLETIYRQDDITIYKVLK